MIVHQFQALPPTQDLKSAASFPNVTTALLAHDYQPDEVRKIVGGNWLRLHAEVWQG